VSARSRLSICYVVPGHSLVASAGPTRNVLSLARALSRWADVTVAFQRVADAEAPDGVRLEEIEPGARLKATRGDDAAVRGLGYGEFLSYLRQLRRFAAAHLLSYDVVLEKSWRRSGYLSSYCRRRARGARREPRARPGSRRAG
jgi:hypothetical protein